MKIVYIHFHLKTGGVTTVIRQQSAAVKDSCETMVITGTGPVIDFPAHVKVIPELAYDGAMNNNHGDPDSVAEKIIHSVSEKWPEGCDIFHIHNPTLAKNRYFLKIIKSLQKKKQRVFLQIHDFAEDGRPGAFFKEDYPENCHYGVINQRDHRFLSMSGLIDSGLHMIPNMVSPMNLGKNLLPPIVDNLVVYPVRAIRRKNIGEAILVSCFFPKGQRLAITLPPNSPADIASHQGWQRFSRANNLGVEFEASVKKDFRTLIKNAKFLLTTSITEGFGFSFLEPWTAGKMLWGRRLEAICLDFESQGVNLDKLYSRLMVPINWIGKEAFRKKWEGCLEQQSKVFGILLSKNDISSAYHKITKDSLIDFGLLDEKFQKIVISRAISSRQNADLLTEINPFLKNPGPMVSMSIAEDNKRAVLENYSMKKYRQRLLAIYTRVLGTRVNHGIDKKTLFSLFMDPSGFSLLKWSDYVE